MSIRGEISCDIVEEDNGRTGCIWRKVRYKRDLFKWRYFCKIEDATQGGILIKIIERDFLPDFLFNSVDQPNDFQGIPPLIEEVIPILGVLVKRKELPPKLN